MAVTNFSNYPLSSILSLSRNYNNPNAMNELQSRIGQGYRDGIVGIQLGSPGDYRINYPALQPTLSAEKQYKMYLQNEGGDIDREYGERFKNQNIFSRAKDYLGSDRGRFARGLLGLLTGGPLGAVLGYNAPAIGGGISDFFNRFRSPAQIPANTQFGDIDMSRGATSSSGESVSSSDLSSIGNTGFSEYSDPGTAASYEGSF